MADSKLKGKAELESVKGLKVNCEARGKTFVLDEPKDLGGSDAGMNPIESMLASLGACKCIVTKIAAQKMGINLEGVSVECEGTMDFGGFMGTNPDAKIGLSNIESVYTIKSSSSDEEIEKLIAFVDTHCPVHDTILNSPSLSHVIKRV